MRAPLRAVAVASCLAAAACSRPPRPAGGDAGAREAGAREAGAREAGAGLDSLNARLVRAYRTRDPAAYAALYTDTAVFEWPAAPPVRGPAALAAMARANWATLGDMDLRLVVAARRVGAGHATEVGAFEQSFRDAGGARRTEYGRYATLLRRQADGSWRMDRFLGFADSTRPRPAGP